MATTMNMSKRSCVTKRCEAFAPASPSIRPRGMTRPSINCAAAPIAARSIFAAAPSRAVTTRVAASAESTSASSSSETKTWYALVANAEFFLNDVQNESMAEQLRERVRFFKEINREIDFWLVPEPTWLDAKFPAQAKQVRRPCVALVSTDEMWITFMKLRLDRVLKINLGTVSQSEALAVGGKVPEFKKPEKWTAPYSPYSSGWWNVFLPDQN